VAGAILGGVTSTPTDTEPDFLRTTRAAYDTIAAAYAARFDDSRGLAGKPLDLAMLTAFADLVRTAGAGPVADLGCGPGYVTAHLHELGLTAFGIDLSPQMIALARRTHPDLRFAEGSMTALDLPDGGLGGIVAWYSTIHVPQDRLPDVFAEFHRTLAPGGHVLVAFQTGDEHVHRTEGFGHPISLDHYLRPPDLVADLLRGAGLAVRAQLHREPDGDGVEKAPRAYLLARKPD
jgi:SAM-dependent methyltransferase